MSNNNILAHVKRTTRVMKIVVVNFIETNERTICACACSEDILFLPSFRIGYGLVMQLSLFLLRSPVIPDSNVGRKKRQQGNNDKMHF